MAVKLADNTYGITLAQAYAQLLGNEPQDIPFLVWLLENPDSPVALPGKIYLREHDYLHILLGRSQSAADEAYVIGFTMGSDLKTNWFHLVIFKFVARYFYPNIYRFSRRELEFFDLGFADGRSSNFRLNQIDFQQYQKNTVATLRQLFGIDLEQPRQRENANYNN